MQSRRRKVIARQIRKVFDRMDPDTCPYCFVREVQQACARHGISATSREIVGRVPDLITEKPRVFYEHIWFPYFDHRRFEAGPCGHEGEPAGTIPEPTEMDVLQVWSEFGLDNDGTVETRVAQGFLADHTGHGEITCEVLFTRRMGDHHIEQVPVRQCGGVDALPMYVACSCGVRCLAVASFIGVLQQLGWTWTPDGKVLKPPLASDNQILTTRRWRLH